MLKIHRDFGAAGRQAEVEGCYDVQVGVDWAHKLSLIITTNHTSFSFNTFSLFHYQKKKIFHKNWNNIEISHTRWCHIFNHKQRAALALAKCYDVTSLTSDSTSFGALDSATQMTTSLKLKFTPNALIYRFEHLVIILEPCNDVTQLSALFFTVWGNLFQMKEKQRGRT
jgi:hypothetical protein